MKIETIIDCKLAKKNKDGIWCTDIVFSPEVKISHSAWQKIYNQNLKQLIAQKKEFNKYKLDDHIGYIKNSYRFSKETIYLEIGCGPAYIGEYLMKQYDCYFVGVDFNYPMLLTLKRYFDKIGYKKYLLIHANILNMPLKNGCIDYIYGGGVIEHMQDTRRIMKELYRVLKKGGIAFNTIPAFNLWWITRFWNNIPNIPILKQIFEFIHIKILNGRVLDKYFGYELSYTINGIKSIHKNIKFKNISGGSFVFTPSPSKVKSVLIQNLYKFVTSNNFFTPVYYVYGNK